MLNEALTLYVKADQVRRAYGGTWRHATESGCKDKLGLVRTHTEDKVGLVVHGKKKTFFG